MLTTPIALCIPLSLAFLIPILVMNICTDIMIMVIPIPVGVQCPKLNELLLTLILFSGPYQHGSEYGP